MNGENLNNNNNMPDMDDALWDMPTDMNNMTYVEGQGYVNSDYYNAWKEHAEDVKAKEEAAKKEALEAEPAPEDKKQLKMSWAMMMNYYKKNPDEISDLTEDEERAAKAAEGVRNDDRKELDNIITEYIAAGRKKLGKVAVEAVEEAESEEIEDKAEEIEDKAEEIEDKVEEIEDKAEEIEDKAEEIDDKAKPDFSIGFEMDDDWEEQQSHGQFATDIAVKWLETMKQKRTEMEQAFKNNKITQEDYDKWQEYFSKKEEELKQKVNDVMSKTQGKRVPREMTDRFVGIALRNFEDRQAKEASAEEEDDKDETDVISAEEANAMNAKIVPAEVVNEKREKRRELAKKIKRPLIRVAAVAGVALTLLTGTTIFQHVTGRDRAQAATDTNPGTETEATGITTDDIEIGADGSINVKAGVAAAMDGETAVEEAEAPVDLSEYKTEHGEIVDLDRTFTASLGDEQVSMNTISRKGAFNMLREDTYYQSGKRSEHSFTAAMYEGEHKGVESDKEALANFNKLYANSHELASIIDDNLAERRDETGGLARINEQADSYTDNDEAFNVAVERISSSIADFADGGKIETRTINAGRKYGSLYEQEVTEDGKMVYSELKANEIEGAADKEVKPDATVVKNEDRHGFMLYNKDGEALITKEKAAEYFGVPASKIDSVWILEECDNVAILYKAQKKKTVQPQQVVVTPITVTPNTVTPPGTTPPPSETPPPEVPPPEVPPPEVPPPETPPPSDEKDPEAIKRNMGIGDESTEKVVPEGADEKSERPEESSETPASTPMTQEQSDANERAEEEKSDAEEKSQMSDNEAAEYFRNFNSGNGGE